MGARFWKLWTASAVSNLADGVFKVVLPLVAALLTRDPLLIAGLTATVAAPWLLFSLVMGAIVDRVDRRLLMLAGNAARAGVLIVIAAVVLSGVDSIALLYVAALGVGSAEVAYDTAAQTMTPRVVRREQLTAANGRLFAAELTANEFLGPILGGVLVSLGILAALAAPAGLWLVAIGVLILLTGDFRTARATTSTLGADVLDGLRELWRSPALRSLSVITAGFNFASGAVMAILVLYAVGPESPMRLDERQYGLLLATTAAGGLVGSLLAGPAARSLGRSGAMMAGLIAAAVFIGVPAVTTRPIVIGAGFFIGGAGIMVVNVIAVTLRQEITPITSSAG